ncbi:hypothetical protein [Lysinibacillus fusiformis]
MTYSIEKSLMSGLPNQALTEVKYVIAHESGNGTIQVQMLWKMKLHT